VHVHGPGRHLYLTCSVTNVVPGICWPVNDYPTGYRCASGVTTVQLRCARCAWLVVVTAVGRYIAICRPLEARRDAAGPRNTGLAAAAAFVGSALVELPSAWTYSISRFDCPDTYYLLDQGAITSSPRLHTTLTCLSAAVQFLLPAAILSFCTTRLVQALRESGRIQRRYWTVVRATVVRATVVRTTVIRTSVVRATASMVHTGSTSTSPKGRRLTVILVAIVACFLPRRKNHVRGFPDCHVEA